MEQSTVEKVKMYFLYILERLRRAFESTSGQIFSCVSLVWWCGYLGVGFVWAIPACTAYVVWLLRELRPEEEVDNIMAETPYEKFPKDVEDLGTIQRDKKYHISERLANPDVYNVEWMNQMIKQMWPLLSEIVKDVLQNDVQVELQKELPSLLKSLHFSEVDLGTNPLRINGVKVYTEYVRDTEIIMDLDFVYDGDAVVKMALSSGITAGISDIQIRGRIRVELNPLLPVVPLVGAIRIYFLEPPEFEFDLTNLLNILDFPGISDIFRSSIGKVIDQFVVLPNSITIPLADAKYLDAITYPMPLGVVQVNVLAGKNLTAKDTSLFSKPTSDPYVIATVGALKRTSKTKVVENSLNPVWKDEPFTAFVNTLVGFEIRFDVFDKDLLKDDKMGHAEIDMVEIAKGNSYTESWLKLEDISSGFLHVERGWYDFSSNVDDIKKKGKDDKRKERCCLFVKIKKAINIPAVDVDNGTSNSYIEMTVSETTQKSKTMKNTVTPEWKHLFSFFVDDPSENEANMVEIKILDTDADEPLGTFSYKIADLLKKESMTEEEKSYKLENCATDAQLFASFQLKAIVSSPTKASKTDK